MGIDLIVQYTQKRHAEMLSAHCDSEQRKSLQPILQEDLRALGAYKVPYSSRAAPDYGRAQLKVSWDIVESSDRARLLGELYKICRWAKENPEECAKRNIRHLTVIRGDMEISLLDIEPSDTILTPSDSAKISAAIATHSLPSLADFPVSSSFSTNHSRASSAANPLTSQATPMSSRLFSTVDAHPPRERSSTAGIMLPTPEASPMLDNAEAPWMGSPSVAGQKRPRADDPFPGDHPPDIVPSTFQSVSVGATASALPSTTSPDEQERVAKRVKVAPERTVLPKFQKKPNSANFRGSAAQTQSPLLPKPSTGAAQPSSSRNVLGIPARLNHVAEPSSALQRTAALVSRSQLQNVAPPPPAEGAVASNAALAKAQQDLKDALQTIQEMQESHRLDKSSWKIARASMEGEVNDMRHKVSQAYRERDEARGKRHSASRGKFMDHVGDTVETLHIVEREKSKLESKFTKTEIIVETLQKENEKLNSSKHEIRECLRRSKTVAEQAEAKAIQLTSENERLEHHIRALEADLQQVKDRAQSAEDVNGRLEENNAILEKENDSLLNRNRTSEGQIMKLQTDQRIMDDRIKSLEADKKSLSARIQSLIADNNRVENLVEALETDKEQFEAYVKSLEADKKSLGDRVKALRTTQHDLEERRASLQDGKELFMARVKTLEAGNALLETRVHTLEAGKKQLEATLASDRQKHFLYTQELCARLTRAEATPVAVLECSECQTKADFVTRVECTLEKERTSSQETIAELKKNLNLARNAHREAEARVIVLGETVAALQRESDRLMDYSATSLNDAVQSLCKDLSMDISGGGSESQSGSATPVEGDDRSTLVVLRRDLQHEQELRQSAELSLLEQKKSTEDMRAAWNQCQQLLESERKEHARELHASFVSAQDNCNMVRREFDERAGKKDKIVKFKTEQMEKLQSAYSRQLEDSEAHTQKIRELTRALTAVHAELEELSQWKADHTCALETEVQAKLAVEEKIREYEAVLQGVSLDTAAEFIRKLKDIAEKVEQPPDP